jgi:DegV family protein with EDD domain
VIKIIADSTCDLSQELIEKYNIDILPLHIYLGEAEYEDGINIVPEQIYQWSDKNKQTPKTSAVSLNEAVELFRKYESQDIICFSISGEMSSTVQVMKLAAQELDREEQISIIDSRSLSTGIGLLIIEAAVMADNGKTADEIVKAIEELIPRVRASFVVDTLTFLHRGGRCSAVSALAGGALKIHPKIVVENGKMDAAKKYRGRMEKVIPNYVKEMQDELRIAKHDRVFITHSGCPKETIEEVYRYLKELDLFNEILVTRAGSVISSHCGPGTLGVLYIK